MDACSFSACLKDQIMAPRRKKAEEESEELDSESDASIESESESDEDISMDEVRMACKACESRMHTVVEDVA